MVRAFAHGVTKVVVCAILSGMVYIKELLLLIKKVNLCSDEGGFSLSLIRMVLYHMSETI